MASDLKEIEQTINNIANERARVLARSMVAEELRKLANSWDKGPYKTNNNLSESSRRRKYQPVKRGGKPKGAINSSVLAVLTTTPMPVNQIADRVSNMAPHITAHQVARAVSQLFLRKKCVRSGKIGKYRYSKLV